jgi:hypothetical protein
MGRVGNVRLEVKRSRVWSFDSAPRFARCFAQDDVGQNFDEGIRIAALALTLSARGLA